jgi:2-polyprenyl-6-methoxyphenol hydroxylase-like FAD-dependent oxidoreductase
VGFALTLFGAGDNAGMRIAVVGAGVAGLTAALALQRDGHEVLVHEQAEALRDAGFGLNLWTNAGSLLVGLGVDIPGEPYDHISFRAGGRHRATMRLPAPGQPHMNVERGALLRAILAQLGSDTVRFGSSVGTAQDLLDAGADLVVAADGVGSRLRPDAATRQRRSRPWAVWQAVIPAGADLIEPGGGAVVLGQRRFYGIWRHRAGELCWFVEEPSLPVDATSADVLAAAASDEDPLVRSVAELTPVDRIGQWLARDRRPTKHVVGDRIVAIGDAAHPMLPCIGQGACTSIEDGVALALSLRGRSIDAGLDRYLRWRLPITRVRVATAHFACTLRRPSPIASTVADTPLGIPFAHASGAWMRLVNRADRRLMD